MGLLWKSLPFLDVKAEDGDGSEFSGYCAAFHNVDSYGDLIMPGAFTKTLPDFLANGQICFNHGEVIGKPLEAREDAKGLFIRARVSDTQKGRDCKTLLKDGVMRKMSIGYRTLARRPCSAEDVRAYWKAAGYAPGPDDELNLQSNSDYLNFLTELKLYEASPVGFPANVNADITGVKSPIRLERVKELLLRVKKGRVLSKATYAYLKAVHETMAPAVGDLKALLDLHDPDVAGGTDDQGLEDDAGTGSNGGASKPAKKPKAEEDDRDELDDDGDGDGDEDEPRGQDGGDTDESSPTKPKPKKPKKPKHTGNTRLAKARTELLLLSVDPIFTRASHR